jgi:hypothetical protein
MKAELLYTNKIQNRMTNLKSIYLELVEPARTLSVKLDWCEKSMISDCNKLQRMFLKLRKSTHQAPEGIIGVLLFRNINRGFLWLII